MFLSKQELHSCVQEFNMRKHWSPLCALILAFGTFVYLNTVSFAEADGSFRVKQGRCPQKHWGTAKCAEFCYRDTDCPDDEKCCSNGCGHECTAPYKVKPGRCGFPQRTQMCAEYCYHDGQCTGSEKCCRTTCGHACSEPC